MYKAFTLIEVLIVALLVSIIGISVSSAMINSQKLSNEGHQKVMIVANTNRIMNEIGKDVRESVLLKSYGNTLEIIDRDSLKSWWIFTYSGVYYVNPNGLKKQKMIGIENCVFNNYDTIFTVDTGGSYHKVDIEIDMTIYEPNGTMNIPTIKNTYYTRTDHTGIGF